MDDQSIATTSAAAAASRAPDSTFVSSPPQPQEAPQAPTTTQHVSALFHHATYHTDIQNQHGGKFTECWAIFSLHSKAIEGLKTLVRRFPPAPDKDNAEVEAFLRNGVSELGMVQDREGKDRGLGLRYLSMSGASEEVMWVQKYEVDGEWPGVEWEVFRQSLPPERDL